MRPEVTEDVIRACIGNNMIGEVDSIDIIKKNSTLPDDPSKHYMMAFIHMKSWSNSLSDNSVREMFLNKVKSTGVNIVYDEEGHYIVLRENHNPNNNPQRYSELERYYNESQMYIENLRNESERIKHSTLDNYNLLLEARKRIDDLQKEQHEIKLYNEQIEAHNNTLQEQLGFMTSQYIPTAFPLTDLNPYANSFQPQSDTDTQVSQTSDKRPSRRSDFIYLN
jgi:hypothetical protein